MTTDELIWRVAGGSGDGVDSTGQNFTKALMRSGLDVFTHRHYPSRIRGGHTYVEIRASNEPVSSRGDGFNFLLALGDSFARNTDETAVYGNEEIKPLSENLDDLREGGVIVYDTGQLDASDVPDFDERVEENDWSVFPIDLRAIAQEHGREIMRNTAGVGATAAIVGMDLDPFEQLMSESMGEEILEANVAVLEDAYDHVTSEFDTDTGVSVPTGSHDEDQVLLSGSHGISYAAIDEGCRFIAGYPMTPWTDVFTIMSQELEEMGGISEQVESEIAAASVAVGASHAGAKAMTGSSGGGFALMSEPLSMAEMTETPLVMVEAMRAGPSTGMPTKTEQADLEHVLYTGQGDHTRIVFAPGDPIEAYEQTRKAFQLAWKYQMPAIVVYDQKLAGEYRNVPKAFFDQDPNPDLGTTLTEAELEDAPHDPTGRYQRYQYDVEDNASPRSLPGQKNGRYLVTGNEHWPNGQIAEDPTNRVNQVNRRRGKLSSARQDLDDMAESFQTYWGVEDADIGVITWGSQQGTVAEAVENLAADGVPVAGLGVSELQPFPKAEVVEFVESVDTVMIVEMNASAQFRGLFQRELGAYGEKTSSLLKYNGEPYRPGEIEEAVDIELNGGGEPTAQVTLQPATGD